MTYTRPMCQNHYHFGRQGEMTIEASGVQTLYAVAVLGKKYLGGLAPHHLGGNHGKRNYYRSN